MAKLVFLGKLSDVCDDYEQDVLDLPTVADLRGYLKAQFSEGVDWSPAHVKIAVDGELASDDTPLENATEIALMPPVGGG